MLFLLVLVLVLSIPAVQSRLAKKATDYINKEFNTNIVVKKIDLSFLGSVELKGVEIRDHHKDTLIFVESLKTSLLKAKRILNNQVNLGDATLSGAYFYMKKYEKEDDDSFAIFLDSFKNDKPKDSINPFVLKTDNIYVDNLTYKFINKNEKKSTQFAAYNIGGNIQDFEVNGSNIYANVRGLHFTENRGVNITNMVTDFTYTRTSMTFDDTRIQTDNETDLVADIVFKYNRKDFVKFTDKVNIQGEFDESKFSVKDLNKFYNELRGGDLLYFTADINGVLNNFSLNDVDLYSRYGMRVKGDMGFVNSFNTDRGFLFDADVVNVRANYYQLRSILPNVLGKKLPSSFRKLGTFNLSGLVKFTPDQMEATLNVASEIGTIISDLQLTNISNIEQAAYGGEVEFIDLDLGSFAENSKLGKVSLRADVDGSGFNVDNINTTIIGRITNVDFNGYSYKNLNVNGQFRNKLFDGFMDANDEDFNLEFTGLADFSAAINKFDFTANIDRIDLVKTNLFKRDSTAILKGEIKLDVSGNTLDNIVGKANFKNLKFINSEKTYEFKEFEVNSSIQDSIKTISANSEDIVTGSLNGKFTFDELLPVCKNALGSVYTNYKPIPVAPNQFVNFDFTLYNQIVEIFFPEITIGSNTKIKGRINSNKNAIKLTISSPKLDVYDNLIENIVLRLDNKNRLYNTHLTADKVSTKYYKLNELNLLNRTVNDTLFFKSTFKGGTKDSEDFNLDFFYTINENQKSVVGLQKSILNFNNYEWIINPNKDHENKLTFDLDENFYSISPFLITSEEQKIEFSGDIKGNDFKDLSSKFTNFEITSIIPKSENFSINGTINGALSLSEKNNIIIPTADLTVDNVTVNDFSQGRLKMNIEGQNSFEKYKVAITLRDYKFDNVSILGTIDFSATKPMLDLAVNFKEYELNGFSDFGGEVIENIRGTLSGDFTVKGEALNPDFNGSLKLNDAGLTFPYLNIDFDFIENTTFKLEEQSFSFKNLILQDTKYDTKGRLSGTIRHQNFEKWYLDLNLGTQNLLILDTKEVDDIPYYGKGFIKGSAQISGLTDNLNIDVYGSTEPGTVFVLPLNDITTIDNYKLIRFKQEGSEDDKSYELEKFKGLNLNINLDVTKDAIAQVVIDKASGSDLKGSGDGNLRIEIDTRGKFKMFGEIAIDNGSYNFKYGGVISKPFNVQKGGTISWDGDPLSAELDITAIYQTKANPAQLLDNVYSTRKIPIDLYTKISGGLLNSKQEFDIKIPNANSTLASELEFKLNANDINTKMQHFTFLLALGTFYDEESLGNSISSGITGTAAQVLSGVLTNVLNKEGSKFKVGVGYTQGDRSDVTSYIIEDQVDVSVSTQVSDRVLVNGKVGVPVAGETQTSVVGEVKVEVLLNEEGNFRANFFNKPNDIQFSLDEEGYTQGLGLSYQVNFNNLKELKEKLTKKKQKDKKTDSIFKIPKDKRIRFNTKKDTTTINNEKNN